MANESKNVKFTEMDHPDCFKRYYRPPKPVKDRIELRKPPGYYSDEILNEKALTTKRDRKGPSSALAESDSSSALETDILKLKKAWELALAPAKALPMNGIMMYMSGNSLQIFSIMMVFMLFKNPIVGLMQINQAFQQYQTDANRNSMLAVKACYVLMQLLALGLGVWKVNGMGLLPTTTSDWLAWESPREPGGQVVFALK